MALPFRAPFGLVGYGISGRATHRLLKLLGVSDSDIAIYDRDPLVSQFATPEDFLEQFKPQTLVVSPGFPLSTPWLVGASRTRAVTSELDLAAMQLTSEKLVGVTGSLGKSTTTSLIAAAFEAAGLKAFAGGNLGIPLADYVADVFEKKRLAADWVVLELSSFQLENLSVPRFEYGVFSYFCSNHLERYQSLTHYYETKWKLASLSKKIVVNEKGGDLRDFVSSKKGPPLLSASVQRAGFPVSFWKDLQLVGSHNRDNVVTAAEIFKDLGLLEKAQQGLKTFPGLPHRLENLGDINGIHVINDSKATAMASVLSAVESILSDERFQNPSSHIWVLLGGRDKKLPWEELSGLSRENRLRFVFFGESRELVSAKSGLKGSQHATLRAAVESLKGSVRPGDTVLLSPGGTSLDEFKNFEDRGQKFSAWAKELLV
jgi:UDP-N-acetylmuramoylalanine--D-glutamate ligase